MNVDIMLQGFSEVRVLAPSRLRLTLIISLEELARLQELILKARSSSPTE